MKLFAKISVIDLSSKKTSKFLKRLFGFYFERNFVWKNCDNVWDIVSLWQGTKKINNNTCV